MKEQGQKQNKKTIQKCQRQTQNKKSDAYKNM